jgi:hypothetical protein
MGDKIDNLYTNLKTLIWGAFVGIVSFQLLGPNLTSAIHSQVGWSDRDAYAWFSVLYLTLPSVICLIYLIREFRSFKGHLSPFGKAKLDWPSGILLWGVGGFWALQLLTTIIFHFPGIFHPTFGAFRRLLFWESVVCSVLFLSGAWVSFLKLRNTRNISRSDNGYFIQLLVTCLLIYFLSGVALFAYVGKGGQKIFLKNGPDPVGFVLLEKKDSLTEGVRQIAHVIDQIRLEDQSDKIAKGPDSLSVVISDTAKKKTLHNKGATARQPSAVVHFNPAFTGVLHIVDSVTVLLMVDEDRQYHRLRKIGARINRVPNDSTVSRDFLVVLNKELDSLRKGVASDSSLVADIIDTLNEREKSLPDSASYLPSTLAKDTAEQERAALRNNYGNYLRELQAMTNYLVEDFNRDIREEVGDQLRYTQLIGTPVLLGLFLSLLSIYIFLKMNSRLTQKELDALTQARRRLTAIGSVSPDRENTGITKEEETDEAKELCGNIWLFITIVVWLLAAFFKPIDDDKIDLADPFKTLTFSDPRGPFGGGEKPENPPQGYSHDTTITVTRNLLDSVRIVPYLKDTLINRRFIDHDTVYRFLQIDTSKVGKDLDEIKKKLNYLVPTSSNKAKP